MRRILMFVCGLLALNACAPVQEKATLVVCGEPGKEVLYWDAGQDDLYFYTLGKHDTLDAQGYFLQEYSLSEPTKVAVNVKGAGTHVLYLTPGSKDTLTFSKDTVLMSGTNAVYNQCLAKVDAYQTYCDELLYGRHELDQASSLEEFKRMAHVQEAKATDFISTAEISETFKQEQLAHIDYISRMILIHGVFFHVREVTDEWKDELRNVLEKDWDTPYMRSYRGIYFMLTDMPLAQYMILEGKRNEKIANSYEFIFNKCAEMFTGKTLEHIWANYIYTDIVEQRHTPEVIPLYERFTEKYPDSHYHEFLKSGMEESACYNQGELDTEKYYLLPCDSTMHSLADVVKPFEGKVVYMDVWATWCGPCKNIFQYVPGFKEKAKGLDVVYLYLSIDEPKNEKAWKKAISFYDLKGYHVLASEELSSSVCKELGNERGVLSIPRFVIFDKTGRMVEPHAASPENADKLLEQLSHYVNE